MIFKLILFLQTFLFVTSCDSSADVIKTIEGIVVLTYVKDTTEYGRYWLIDKKFDGQYLIEDISDVVGNIYLICGTLDIQVPEVRGSFYDSPEYKIQEKQVNDFYTHYGGEVFTSSKGQLSIAFQMKAQVIVLEEKPCDNFYFQNFYSCPVQVEKIEYPIHIVVDVIETKSLDTETLKNKRLTPYTEKSFRIGRCD